MRGDFDFIVVGLGGIGSAAAYWLAKRCGRDVLGLEQFELGHVRGASQDHSRIIRHSYHSSAYVELTKSAYAAWDQLEADGGERLIVKTGGLDLWPPHAAIPMDDYTSSLTTCGVGFDILGANELRARWPQFHLDDDVVGLYQADGGIAPAARCNAAHIRVAREMGTTLVENCPVTSIREVGGEIEVTAPVGTFRCDKVIVTADAWTNEVLASLDVSLPLTVTQEQVTYFAARNLEDFSPDRFPIWIWMDEPSFYGFPVFGEPGVKVAQDVGGKEVTPETRTFEPDKEVLKRVTAFLEQCLPSALGPAIYTKTCLYTMPPDRDLVIDRVTGHDNVLVALGAAHGFKFASLIGRVLSELAIDGSTDHDIGPFRMDRPRLTEKDPVKSFMI